MKNTHENTQLLLVLYDRCLTRWPRLVTESFWTEGIGVYAGIGALVFFQPTINPDPRQDPDFGHFPWETNEYRDEPFQSYPGKSCWKAILTLNPRSKRYYKCYLPDPSPDKVNAAI
jgi:hypothetical protein